MTTTSPRTRASAGGAREGAGCLRSLPAEELLLPADAPTGSVESTAGLGSAQPTRLRQLLIGLDLAAAALAWTAAFVVLEGRATGASPLGHLVAVPLLSAVTVVLANARRLYRSQVCSIRAVETQRLCQVVLLVGLAAALTGPELGLTLSTREVLVGCVLTFVFSSGFRSCYRSWLSSSRRQGRFRRQIVIVSAPDEAEALFELVAEHPQLGLDVIGMIGDLPLGAHLEAPLLGPRARTEELVRASEATGVLIGPAALDAAELNQVTRNLLQAGVHVHLSSGLRGFAAHRVRPQLLAHESVLYLEPLRLARWQLAAKRALDVTVGASILVLSLPVIAIAAIAIKLDDGGPVIFRQARVGRQKKHFTMLKLRTMVPDAEERYDELASSLAGREGPLVKLVGDPRITRVGRVLRATSIDELPQLVNVIRGSMSLVGPRPNLLVEAERLDPAFLAHKCQVRPGISGLWQVEARDDPSFTLYRRLDVYYLENWSISLDLTILLVTIQRVAGRALRLLVSRRPRRRVVVTEVAGSPGS